MSQEETSSKRLPKGVKALARSRGGRRFLARIRHKGVELHLGLYATAGEAGLAFKVASEAIGRRSRSRSEIPGLEQPDAVQVREITARVRRRLGLDQAPDRVEETPPDLEALLTFFEVTVVGFWREQAAQSSHGHGIDAAARRLVEAAELLFWSPSLGHPDPSEAIARLVARRLDSTFHQSVLTRDILDDDGDEDWRVARWLVYPDVYKLGRGFRDEVRFLYSDRFPDDDESIFPHGVPHWAQVLRVEPPFNLIKIRQAYRSRSKSVHPDAGGTHGEFVQLQAAYEEARDYCRVMGI
jgi:hypothetical protein